MSMLNLKIAQGISTIIFVSLTLAGCGGAGVASYSPATQASTGNTPPPRLYTPPFVPPSSSIGAVVAACAAEPMRGTVHYYCDCRAGAATGCVAGSDTTNDGLSPSTPKQTLGNASALSRSLQGSAVATLALCKGGAFDSGTQRIGSSRCGAGVTCTDFREYTPPILQGVPEMVAKPIINNAAGESNLFTFVGNGGVRMLNLKLQGDGGSPGNRGVFFYQGAHDVTMCNLDMDAFSIAVYNESDAGLTKKIKLTGSYITNSRAIGYLGGGDDTHISYNYWLNNGSDHILNHTIYLASSVEIKNVVAVGNYVRGQYGLTCRGVQFVGHFVVNGLLVKDNVVDVDASAITEGCWGMAFTNTTNAPGPIYHRNTLISGNTIKNGGNLALTVTGCPDCVIENNLIINETSKAGTGIGVAAGSVRQGKADDVNTRNVIRNNTIWYGPNSNAGGTGIGVGTEGTGHIIANNSVTYSAGTGAFNCFNYPLTLASYAFINNNHCESAAPYKWEATRGSLAAWQTYATSAGFDTASFTGNPLFTAAGTNFTPTALSPLIGKGDTVNKSVLDFTGKARPTAPAKPAIGAYEP